MKNKHRLRVPKKARPADPFQLPTVELLDERQVLQTLAPILAAKPTAPVDREATDADGADALSKALAAIATNAWKARSKMVNELSGEPREEMKRVYGHIQRILDSITELGLEIEDRTGEPFHYGLPLKVVTARPTPGIKREQVAETIKPTIYWRTRIIQIGEVVIATPP
jgi:hypothetical protein